MSASVSTCNGTPLSPLALGTTGTGTAERATRESDDARIRLFRSAIEMGINIFDTAEIYGGGHSETLVGTAAAPCRESVFISTKCNPGNATADGIVRAVEGSLGRLGTDYIDLYQLHWPTPFIPFEESWSALARLLDTGKIRYVGVGNCSYDEFLTYQELSDGRITSVELPFNVAAPDAARPFLDWAEAAAGRIFAYSPLGQGRLGRAMAGAPVAAALMEAYGITENQLALAWIASHRMVVPVFKTGSTEHLRENLESMSIALRPEEAEALADACRLPLREVPLSGIRIEQTDERPVYATCEEALENRLDWIPSPALLAERIRRGAHPPPLRLVRRDDGNGHDLDRYDFQGEMKKYWAWRIVLGSEGTVPAYIHDAGRPE